MNKLHFVFLEIQFKDKILNMPIKGKHAIKRKVKRATSISKCHNIWNRYGVYKARSRLPIGLVQSLANTGLSDLKNFLRKCKAIHLKKKKENNNRQDEL